MNKILITGASGFVGSALAQRLLLDPSLELVLAVRNAGQVETDQAKVIAIGDINRHTRWGEALEGVDVIVHAAARAHVLNDGSGNPVAEFRKTKVEGTLALAQQAAEAGIRRFVFISSIGVNGAETGDLPFNESSPSAPHADYAFSKLEGENALKKLLADYDMELVIIRPPLVYSASAPGNFNRLLKLISAKAPLPFWGVKNKRSLIALDNLIDFIYVCLSHPAAANELFLISDREDVSIEFILRKLAEGMNQKIILFYFPSWLIALVLTAVGRKSVYSQLYGSLVIDSSKATDLLGWRPVLSTGEALKASGRLFKKM